MVKSESTISRYVPLIVIMIIICGMLLIPLKIIGYGYLPVDDALRHCAKIISGKDWSQILVLRPEARMDNHPGWHAILGFVHNLTGSGADGLVIFSVVSLFLLFCLVPVFFLRRPEAWLCALLVVILTSFTFIGRLLFGRPFIVTMSLVLVFCLLWKKLKEKNNLFGAMALFTALVAVDTWIHVSLPLLAIPIIALFLAREFRAGTLFTAAVALGIILGAMMTGHPYLFLKQNIVQMHTALGKYTPTKLLVSELQPFSGDVLTVGVVICLLIWRRLRGSWNVNVIDNPVFILAVIGWILGFVIIRFWLDWGLPAILVWIAYEFQSALNKYMGFSSVRRILLAAIVMITFYLAVTADIGSRWTYKLTTDYIDIENEKQAQWLPEPGGIIYSDDMSVFYDTFFKNPNAPWRYILGYESTLMPQEDLAILRKIQWNNGAYESFKPWVKKMRPQDRLVLRRSYAEEPKIPGLEWYYIATDTWIGRLPRGKK